MLMPGDGGVFAVMCEEAQRRDEAQALVLQSRAQRRLKNIKEEGERDQWSRRREQRQERARRRALRRLDRRRMDHIEDSAGGNAEEYQQPEQTLDLPLSFHPGDDQPRKDRTAPSEDEPSSSVPGGEELQASRARRRAEKRKRKAKAKELRALMARSRQEQYPGGGYYRGSQRGETPTASGDYGSNTS
ncbi:hypothetical protein PPTG_11960 [Phytophthora nicotianae INRA-310]|uniref:Uncharacterized protein n=1 Tax=Phytophthora nicotianae (strain INRA-310) TaxID=761204 RepID=W2Q4L3_PHYN3|nr:hypothetical protein PPTG_11960 [Phytophthora nicotianae INRA-310]ETN08092.1 hypothetical protein PPTG_11960 [Phytophthora nicotianae INRA-310]